MEMLVVLVIVVIGVLVIGSIMGMTASGRITKLERQNLNLNERVKLLEAERGQPRTAPAPIPKVAPKPIATPERETASVTATHVAPVKRAPKPAPPKPEPKPAKPTRNLEELIGGQWSVWVGGLALLVGAVLLIRFSIEAGFFGPTARIVMALGLGALLLVAGEWLKRSDEKLLKGKLGEAQKALQSNASIPGLLSAVGVFSLLGATYAAHALYGLIPAAVAFIGLGVISIAAMGLSLRQGPLLAAIGLLASMATPLLIQSDPPNFVALVGYLLVIGVAALGVAQRTKWGWLATGTVFGWLGWSAMSMKAATNGQMVLWAIFLAIGFGVTVWWAEQSKPQVIPKGEASLARLDLQPALALFWGAVAALLVASVVDTLYFRDDVSPISTLSLSFATIAALLGAAVALKRQGAHLVTAGVLAIFLTTYADDNFQYLMFGSAVAIAVLLALRKARDAKSDGDFKDLVGLWPAVAIALGFGSVVASYVEGPMDGVDRIHAVWALGYSVLFAAAAIYFQTKSRPLIMTISLTVGAALAWAFAVSVASDGLPVSLGYALGASIAVLAIWKLRLSGARLALLGLAGLIFAHAFLIQFPDAESLSARPVLNALWVYLALPTAILGGAGAILHRRDAVSDHDKLLNGIIEAAALAGLALFAVFQIRHLSNGGIVYAESLGFAELGLQVSTGLCFTLAGLSKRFAGNVVLSKMAEVISYVTLAIFGLGSLLGLSPLLNDGQVVTGNIALNSLTTGMLVPTVLLGLCAWRARGRRPDTYINVLGGLALAGAMSWMTAMVRFGFNGTAIDIFDIGFSDLELWTISAIWLLAGIVLLGLGVWKQERALRIASGVIIIATVLKAFLIDMAGLEGVLRAMSFVVLGLVLIVIGRAYQRFWLTDRAQDQPN